MMKNICANKPYEFNNENQSLKLCCYAIMLLVVTFGIYIRFKGLGKWPVSVDEYFMLKSTKNIIKYGVPEFFCGGYYVRGLLYQYIAVPFIAFLNHNEFWMRSISVFFNILTLFPIYLLGKRVSGSIGACIAILFFSLSLWEIEFSRYARMYVFFQCMFMWYLYFLYEVILKDRTILVKWMLMLSGLSIFVYEGSIFLLLLNFLPLFLGNVTRKKSYALLIIGLLILGYIFLSTNFRRLGVENYLPADFKPLTGNYGPIFIPVILLKVLLLNKIASMFYLFTLFLTAYYGYRVAISREAGFFEKLGICLALLFSLLNLFGIAIMSGLIISLMVYSRKKKLVVSPSTIKSSGVIFLFNFLFWTAYCLTTKEWYHLVGIHDYSVYKFIVILFKNPNVFEKILYPCLHAVPLLTVISFAIIALGTLLAIRKSVNERAGYFFLLSVVLCLMLLVGMIKTRYSETRYIFFFYPLIILLVTASLVWTAKKIVKDKRKAFPLILSMAIAFMLITEDFGFTHMIRVDSKEVNFRINYSFWKAKHYLIRMDYRSPAVFVNQNVRKSDEVVSILTPPECYLRQLDYYYLNHRSGEFPGRSCLQGKRDIWTDSKLIYKEQHLLNLIDHSPFTIWLITTSEKAKYRSGTSKKLNKRYRQHLSFTSVDGKINVYRITKSE